MLPPTAKIDANQIGPSGPDRPVIPPASPLYRRRPISGGSLIAASSAPHAVITGGNVTANRGTTSLNATSTAFVGCTVASAPTIAIAELAVDKQAQKLLMPVAARQQLNELPDEMWTKISIEFYKDAADAVFKALVE